MLLEKYSDQQFGTHPHIAAPCAEVPLSHALIQPCFLGSCFLWVAVTLAPGSSWNEPSQRASRKPAMSIGCYQRSSADGVLKDCLCCACGEYMHCAVGGFLAVWAKWKVTGWVNITDVAVHVRCSCKCCWSWCSWPKIAVHPTNNCSPFGWLL